MHLRPLAVRALTLLLENAGSLVAREKLRDTLWDHKVVEWETGLHRITKEIRSALGDDARQPRFIETVARRGYRFCASIDPVEISGNVQGRVSRIRWFLAGTVALPSMVLTFCAVAGISG
ncbi:MAG: winged helix-turn-helix domain-containing protein [Gammaproteobacteria bacterium]|nr:winged helix-turn-helix domain-containing protein [Gammaproteobacteria bacterium]